MGGIVWLASYPKSGNTWVRVFLQNLIVNPSSSTHINELGQFAYGDSQKYWYELAAGGSLEGMSPEAVMALTPKAQYLMTKSRAQSVFVKTHNSMRENWGVPYITAEATVGAIHIIRNPLDVVSSLAHHYGFSIDEAIAFMNNPDAETPEDDHKLPQFYGSWSDHIGSWQKFNPQYIHRVRYEDLLLKPAQTFGGITKFLRIKAPKNILNKAIKNASFKTLQTQEKKDGFFESSDRAERFFRSGKAGTWKTTLNADQVKRLVEVHHDKMQEFGYLKGVSV